MGYGTVRVNVVVCAGTDPDVPVTVTVYVPAGVPPVVPPPLFEDELLPPQAVRKNRPETARNMSSRPSTFFRREPLAPSNIIPPRGSNIA